MKLLIITVVALIVWSEGRPLCEFSSCHECVKIPSCLWYQAKNGEYCSHSRVARSSYTVKIRSVVHCTEDAPAHTTATKDPVPTHPSPVPTTTTNKPLPTIEIVTFPTSAPKKSVMRPERFVKPSVSSRPRSDGHGAGIEKDLSSSSSPPSPSTTTEVATTDKGSEYQRDEKTLKREIDLLQCKEFAAIRRLKKLQRGKPLTDQQNKRIVKNCIKALN